GYLKLAERLWEQPTTYSESWNFGPNDSEALSVAAVLERLRELWGPGISWRFDEGEHPREARSLQLDCTKAKAELGWEARWNINSALEATVLWYKAYQSGQDVRSMTQEQIRSYQNA